jgi:pimeloyl-ACP methyl ester carboxylesterase
MKLLTFLRTLRWPYRVAVGALVVLAVLILYARWDAHRGLDTPVTHKVEPQTPRGAKDLIVFVHGYAKGNKPLEGVIRAAQQARPGADLMYFEYASQVFSNADPFRLASQMEEQIRQLDSERDYERIHLVGYSMGALLLRKAYVYGSGSVEDLPFADRSRATTRPPQDWVKRVDRFVLLAGTNRGWSHEDPPKEMTLWKATVNSFGMFFGSLSGTGMLVRRIQRGEPFVANLRLQWLDVMSKAKDPKSGLKQPVVVQLLGDQDDVVSKEDNRDVTVAKDFIWVGVSNTNHVNVIDLDQPGAGADRKRKILQALGSEEDIAALKRAIPAPARDEDPDVSTVVFVLHGIRDMGEWTSLFESPLQERFQRRHADTGEKIYVHRAGYGYFAMGSFLLWPDRQRNVRWFMDQVTELKSKFPNLKHLHFIGHSNGTYVLASALERYGTLKVDKVVFAGSVVRRSYDWTGLSGRVGKVRNYVGADDLVVGIFPNLFELPLFRLINSDLGSAGFNGFQDGRFKDLETQFVKGGHPAALHPDNVQSIVDFIVDGKKVDVNSLLVKERPWQLSYLSQLCWILWLLLLGFIVLGGVGLVYVARWIYRWTAPKKNISPRAMAWTVSIAYAAVLLMTLNTI